MKTLAVIALMPSRRGINAMAAGGWISLARCPRRSTAHGLLPGLCFVPDVPTRLIDHVVGDLPDVVVQPVAVGRPDGHREAERFTVLVIGRTERLVHRDAAALGQTEEVRLVEVRPAHFDL